MVLYLGKSTCVTYIFTRGKKCFDIAVLPDILKVSLTSKNVKEYNKKMHLPSPVLSIIIILILLIIILYNNTWRMA